MFKQAFGSPRIKTNEQQEEVSILSPRNLIKLITNSIGQLKNNLSVPNHNNYQQFVVTFAPYLQSFEEEIKKHHKNRSKKESSNSKHEQLQLQLKINKIPQNYFVQPDKFHLQLFKRLQCKKRQEELSEYLDEIQLVLFTKAGKYPEKSNIILQNMQMLQSETNQSLLKVLNFRTKLKEKLIKVSLKQLKVKQIQSKIEKMKSTLRYLQIMKKMKDLKDISSSAATRSDGIGNEQVLLKIKKTEIESCFKFKSLKVIVSNLQKYRQSVKQKLYKEFLMHIQQAINQLLQYNKQEWKNINVPTSIFVGQTQINDVSHNNITVLDQSYFAFQSKNVNIVNKRKLSSNDQIIYEENDQQNAQIIDMSKITKLWSLIKEFDLYDEVEVNQQFIKVLMKHNINFNQDMQQYITFLYQSQLKQKNATLSILKGPQTYASLKNKQKEESKILAAQTSNTNNIELSSQKISFMDMKLFLKITKFYYGLLKRVLGFISSSKQFQYLVNFRYKFCQFLQSIITYFTNLKKITHQLSVDDFFTYLQIISFWQNQELDQITQFCENLKAAKIQEYLTNIQKNLLIKELKQAIEQSNYLPITISSDNYMTFHSILSPNSLPQFQGDDINMSMTLQLDQNRMHTDQNSPKGDVKLRLINNYVVYNERVYKICDSFMQLAKNIQKYVKIKDYLPQTEQNVQEKICEIIGFYAWYNQKQITNTKVANKTLRHYCTFYSTLLLLKCVIQSLGITNKKLEKTRVQLNQCQAQLTKLITMTPFMSIEQKISQLYESKISTRVQTPTGQSMKILQVLKNSVQCLKEYFPIEYEQKLHESNLYKFTQTTMKIIYKNYFGYLVNMQKRGIAQVKWFLPKLKQILQITSIHSSNLINKKGEILCKNGSYSFYLFNQELEEMQRILRQKTATKL